MRTFKLAPKFCVDCGDKLRAGEHTEYDTQTGKKVVTILDKRLYCRNDYCLKTYFQLADGTWGAV